MRASPRVTHDFKDGISVEFVSQPILVREKKIRHESQIKLTVRKRAWYKRLYNHRKLERVNGWVLRIA